MRILWHEAWLDLMAGMRIMFDPVRRIWLFFRGDFGVGFEADQACRFEVSESHAADA